MQNIIDIEILNLLLEATRKKCMNWKVIDDPERDLFSSEIGNDSFQIELINLQRAGENCCERALARIQGQKIYQTYAIGTKGYDLLVSILRENIFGWKEGFEGAISDLTKMKRRLEVEISKANK